MPHPTAVLLMAYGTAPSLRESDIRAYLRHILQFYRKTDPTDEEVENLKNRLEAAGGSPLYHNSLPTLPTARSPASRDPAHRPQRPKATY